MKSWRSCLCKNRPVLDNVPVSRLLLLLEIPMVMLVLVLNAPKRLPLLSVELSLWLNCPSFPFVVVSGVTKLANPTLCPQSFCKWLVLRIATRLLVVLLELWAILPRQLMLPLQDVLLLDP